MSENLTGLIREYYAKRDLKWPADADEALQFAETELDEVYELLLARKGGWKRNDPDGKPEFSGAALADELGDVVMMVIVAGIVEGHDPVEALIEKMARKLEAME